MPRFSLVIPTLRRPDTLRHALTTAARVRYDDCEIVVQNNGDDPATRAVVEACGDSRIRHFASASVLPMTENWEIALDNARGDFVAFIGDDDGFLPDACELADRAFALTNAEIVSWLPYCYYWPNYVEPELRNRLVATVYQEAFAEILHSDLELRHFYRFAIDYSRLPMIYNSFIARPLLERVRQALGHYFVGYSPDVTSGVVNAAFTSRFIRLTRPLSMTGLSGHSTGRSLWQADPNPATRSDRLTRDFRSMRIDDRLPALEDIRNILIVIANDMLIAHDRLALKDRQIAFDYHGLVERLAATINDRPDAYAANLAGIRQIALRHGVDLNEIAIPQAIANKPQPVPGTTVLDEDRRLLVVDGDAAGLANIADAIDWIDPSLPRTLSSRVVEVSGKDHAVIAPGQTLRFGQRQSGESGLASGWGDPEAWGRWSVAKRAVLRLKPAAGDALPLRALLKFRPFIHPGHPKTDVVCRARGTVLAKWHCESFEWLVRAFSISQDMIDREGVVEVEFIIVDPASPASLGINADTRPLGIGLQSLILRSGAAATSAASAADRSGFDEEWYLTHYPDVHAELERGLLDSAWDHYQACGRTEKRLPRRPVVDETWYLLKYSDVARAVLEGNVRNAYEHFVGWGLKEGRLPVPPRPWWRRWR